MGGSESSSGISKWGKGVYNDLSGQIKALNGHVYTPYTGALSPALDPLQTKAAGMAEANVGAGRGLLGQAAAGATGASTFQPTHVSAGQIGDADLSKYMNPYMADVVDASMGDIERQRQMAIMQGQGAAAHAGAFGGSRHGVADSLTNGEALRAAASTSAGLRAQGYDRATALAGQDIDRRYSADTANQAADANAAGLRLSGAGLLGNLAAQTQAMGQSDADFVNKYGQQAREAAQQGNLAQYQEFLRGQGATETQIQNLLGLLGATPMTQTTQSQSGGLLGGVGSVLGGLGSLGWSPFG